MRWYFSRIEQIAVVVLLLAIVGALFVLSYAYGHKQREVDNLPFLEQTTSPAVSSSGAPANEVVVHVTGAVKHPGVYHCFPSDRVDDAIRQAGGAREDGYPDALNLAAHLVDGSRITVPTKAEWQQRTAALTPPPLVTADEIDPQQGLPEQGTTASAPAVSSASTKPASPAVKPVKTATEHPAPVHTGPKPLPAKIVHLNTATQEDLVTLPSIGEVTAGHILDYRKQIGKFTDPVQLLDIKGIGQKTFEKIKPFIAL